MFDNSIIANNISYGNVQCGIYESDAVGTNNQYLNNLIYGSAYGTGMLAGQLAGTVTANPQFVNYTGDTGGDYHLTSASPAIGAGTPTGASLASTTHCRPVGHGCKRAGSGYPSCGAPNQTTLSQLARDFPIAL